METRTPTKEEKQEQTYNSNHTGSNPTSESEINLIEIDVKKLKRKDYSNSKNLGFKKFNNGFIAGAGLRSVIADLVDRDFTINGIKHFGFKDKETEFHKLLENDEKLKALRDEHQALLKNKDEKAQEKLNELNKYYDQIAVAILRTQWKTIYPDRQHETLFDTLIQVHSQPHKLSGVMQNFMGEDGPLDIRMKTKTNYYIKNNTLYRGNYDDELKIYFGEDETNALPGCIYSVYQPAQKRIGNDMKDGLELIEIRTTSDFVKHILENETVEIMKLSDLVKGGPGNTNRIRKNRRDKLPPPADETVSNKTIVPEDLSYNALQTTLEKFYTTLTSFNDDDKKKLKTLIKLAGEIPASLNTLGSKQTPEETLIDLGNLAEQLSQAIININQVELSKLIDNIRNIEELKNKLTGDKTVTLRKEVDTFLKASCKYLLESLNFKINVGTIDTNISEIKKLLLDDIKSNNSSLTYEQIIQIISSMHNLTKGEHDSSRTDNSNLIAIIKKGTNTRLIEQIKNLIHSLYLDSYNAVRNLQNKDLDPASLKTAIEHIKNIPANPNSEQLSSILRLYNFLSTFKIYVVSGYLNFFNHIQFNNDNILTKDIVQSFYDIACTVALKRSNDQFRLLSDNALDAIVKRANHNNTDDDRITHCAVALKSAIEKDFLQKSHSKTNNRDAMAALTTLLTDPNQTNMDRIKELSRYSDFSELAQDLVNSLCYKKAVKELKSATGEASGNDPALKNQGKNILTQIENLSEQDKCKNLPLAIEVLTQTKKIVEKDPNVDINHYNNLIKQANPIPTWKKVVGAMIGIVGLLLILGGAGLSLASAGVLSPVGIPALASGTVLLAVGASVAGVALIATPLSIFGFLKATKPSRQIEMETIRDTHKLAR